jgi:hypothetical protein
MKLHLRCDAPTQIHVSEEDVTFFAKALQFTEGGLDQSVSLQKHVCEE